MAMDVDKRLIEPAATPGATAAGPAPVGSVTKDKDHQITPQADTEETESEHEEGSDKENNDDEARANEPRTSERQDPHKAVRSDTVDNDDDVLPPVFGPNKKYDLSELFTNPNFQRKPAFVVFRKDPFCIPRATDNVGVYRPRFNPLNILVSEEKLLPHDFQFDFSEGIPGFPKPSTTPSNERRKRSIDLTTTSDSNKSNEIGGDGSEGTVEGSSFLQRKIVPIRAPPPTFGDKLSTMGLLMGTMPRQHPPTSPATPSLGVTIHNPFREPPMELVATSDPPASDAVILPPLTPITEEILSTTDDRDASPSRAMSKMTIDAGVVMEASVRPNVYNPPFHPHDPLDVASESPSGAPLLDQLARFLPERVFAEKRVPPPPPSSSSSTATLGSHSFLSADAHLHQLYQQQTYGHPEYTPPPLEYNGSVYQVPHDLQQQPQQHPQQPVAKKPRAKNVFRPCTTPGCTRGARGKSGLCQKHGGGKRCAVANCPKGAQGSSTMCLFHGGGYRCTYPGCTTGARGTSGLCARHGGYKRARGSEDADDTTTREAESSGPAAKQPRIEV